MIRRIGRAPIEFVFRCRLQRPGLPERRVRRPRHVGRSAGFVLAGGIVSGVTGGSRRAVGCGGAIGNGRRPAVRARVECRHLVLPKDGRPVRMRRSTRIRPNRFGDSLRTGGVADKTLPASVGRDVWAVHSSCAVELRSLRFPAHVHRRCRGFGCGPARCRFAAKMRGGKRWASGSGLAGRKCRPGEASIMRARA